MTAAGFRHAALHCTCSGASTPQHAAMAIGYEDDGIAEAVGDQMSGIAVGNHAAMT